MESLSLDLIQPTPQEVRAAFIMQIAVEYQLVSIQLDKTTAPLTPLQDSVRLALYLSTQPLIYVTRPNSAYVRNLATQIKDSLEEVDVQSLDVSHRELLLWMLFITAHNSKGEEGWTWCVPRIVEMIDFLGYSVVEQVENMLRGFYHFGDLFTATIIDAWKLRGTE